MPKYIERTMSTFTGRGYEVIIEPDGKSWWFDNSLHRIGTPAVIRSTGTKEYWKKGLRHRTNGPAIIGASGGHWWFVDGVELTKEDFLEKGLDFIIKMQAAELFDPRDLARMRDRSD